MKKVVGDEFFVVEDLRVSQIKPIKSIKWINTNACCYKLLSPHQNTTLIIFSFKA